MGKRLTLEQDENTPPRERGGEHARKARETFSRRYVPPLGDFISEAVENAYLRGVTDTRQKIQLRNGSFECSCDSGVDARLIRNALSPLLPGAWEITINGQVTCKL